MSVKRLIVNADDSNLTLGCDRAINELMDAGAVTSTSCLVWSLGDTRDLVIDRPLQTGVHLRLTDGRPVLDPSKVPTLIDADGNFPTSHAAVAAKTLDMSEVYVEWRAQCACLLAFGMKPTHLDTHRHTHRIPGVDLVYEALVEEIGCAGVPLSGRQASRLRDRGVRCADYTEIRWTDGLLGTLQHLLLADFARYDTVHLMCHPGYNDAQLRGASTMTDVRERERAVLIDPAFDKWVFDNGWKLAAMADLPATEPQLAKVDLIYLAWNRPEFTAESLRALAINTDWDLVRRLIIYTDGEPMRNGYVAPKPIPDSVLEYNLERHGGPVAIMNHYLSSRDPLPWFAKIDNDVVLPPGWLETCLDVVRWHPEVDLLGIEAVYPSQQICMPRIHEPIQTGHIGGIGLMRTAAFDELPVAAGRMGFSDWQIKHDVTKAWLNPSLPVILLDRLPFEPWASLSRKYEAQGWQRPWKRYDPVSDAALWQWWRK